jgi:hypothetical protein
MKHHKPNHAQIPAALIRTGVGAPSCTRLSAAARSHVPDSSGPMETSEHLKPTASRRSALLGLHALMLLALLSTLNSQLSAASALGTGFTYQGRLASGTNNVTGLFDFQFTLYDAASGGTQIGSTITGTALPVTNGYFSVVLDFGNQFGGNALWLNVSVKTNLAGSYTTLAPRQALTASPYALYSPYSGTASLANSVAAGSITSASLAAGAVTSTSLAAGAVTASQLAAGAAASNLVASGQSAVPGGA